MCVIFNTLTTPTPSPKETEEKVQSGVAADIKKPPSNINTHSEETNHI